MSTRKKLDISAYLVVGPENTKGRPVTTIIQDAILSRYFGIKLKKVVLKN